MKKNFSACVFSYNGTSAKCINVEASPLLSPEGAPVPGAWTVPAADIKDVELYAEFRGVLVYMHTVRAYILGTEAVAPFADRLGRIASDFMAAIRGRLWPSYCVLLAIQKAGTPEEYAEALAVRESIKAEREAEDRERERAYREAEERERQKAEAERLEEIREGRACILSGDYITGYQMALLLKEYAIKVHPRTLHNIQTVRVIKSGELRYNRPPKTRKMNADGVFKAFQELAEAIKAEAEAVAVEALEVAPVATTEAEAVEASSPAPVAVCASYTVADSLEASPVTEAEAVALSEALAAALSQDGTPEAEAPQAAPYGHSQKSQNSAKIQDFGQKIGGAHKDRAREAAEKLAGVDASALMLQPLSKVAKLPDLRALFLSGAITEHVARLAWYYWSCIGTKPGSSYPSRLQRWADRAAALIQNVADVLAYGTSEKSPIFNNPEGWKPAQSWDLFNAEMTAANWPEDEYKRGAYFVGRSWTNKERYSIHTEKASYYSSHATVADAVAAIRAKVEKNTTKAPQKFSMYQTSAGVYYITPQGKTGIKLAEFTDKAEAWAAYEDTDKLGRIYEELKKFPSERRDWNRPRMGEDWRQGRDMSPESFAEVFPFRGVEFGNWVNQTERAACLNEAADALQDLAAMIGIRPEAVALGGSLAWAFGSRGVGKALAHYEPARRVVNLTKKKGNGCVAHEWFHALDNYMMIQAGSPSLMAVSDCHAYGDCEKSQISAAAYDLKSALLKSDMYTRSRRIDAFRSTPYWATVTEMAARAFEAVIYYKLEAAGMCNDYLVNFKPSDEWNRSECYPYPTKKEAAQLAPLFDAFIMAAFTEAERAPMVEPSAGLLPEPPAVVTYDPAQSIESAPFHVQDEAPAVAASEPMNAEEDEAPTPADGVQGAAYGEGEKSQNPEAMRAEAQREEIRDWYMYEYPKDEEGERIQPGVTFADIYAAPARVYDYIPNDSIIRERIFRETAARYGVEYSDIYDRWMEDEDPAPTDGATGVAYGDAEKSQNPDSRSEKTKALNKRLEICHLDGLAFRGNAEGEIREYGRNDWAFFIPGMGWVSMPGDDGQPYSPIGGRKALKEIKQAGGYLNYDGFQFVWPMDPTKTISPKIERPEGIAPKEWDAFNIEAEEVPAGFRQYVYDFIEKSLKTAPYAILWGVLNYIHWGIWMKINGNTFHVYFDKWNASINFTSIRSTGPLHQHSPMAWCHVLDSVLSKEHLPLSWPIPDKFHGVIGCDLDGRPIIAGI